MLSDNTIKNRVTRITGRITNQVLSLRRMVARIGTYTYFWPVYNDVLYGSDPSSLKAFLW